MSTIVDILDILVHSTLEARVKKAVDEELELCISHGVDSRNIKQQISEELCSTWGRPLHPLLLSLVLSREQKFAKVKISSLI
jgi:hypothetical protein